MEVELRPYLLAGTHVPEGMYGKLTQYLELLLKWNARTNLTAIRERGEIIRRHFGESLFAAQHLGECETLLDFGSGAGFPGLPIQLLRPDLQVTLAESQNKKATFLREAVRTLDLRTSVWANRVEALPNGQQFDVATMRAVDNMAAALEAACVRAANRIVILTTTGAPLEVSGFTREAEIEIPATREQHLLILTRRD